LDYIYTLSSGIPFGIPIIKPILGDFMSKAKRYNPETNIKKSLEFGRANILYIFLIPITFAIIISLIRLRIFYFILNLVGFALFYMTAKSHSIGIRQEIEYYKKRLAKAPKIPYKLISGLLLGLWYYIHINYCWG